jgi:AsmA protein
MGSVPELRGRDRHGYKFEGGSTDMTATSGFKRLGLALATVLVVGAGLLAVMSLLISVETARDAVKAEIRAVSGLEPVLSGPVSLSFFPFGTVSFDKVTIGEDGAGNKALVADRLSARLRFFPLLIGRIQVSDVTLVRPTISVIHEPSGKSNWTLLAGTLSSALRPSPQRQTAFSEIRIDNGTIVVRDDTRAIAETITNVEGSLAWPSMFRSFAATGRFDWRGQKVDASVSIGDFVAALDGDPSGIKLRLTSAPMKVAFEGQFSSRPTWKIEGTVAADSPSLRDAARWAANKQLPGGGFNRFSMKAKTNLVGSTLALSSVDIEIDGNAAEGVLTFASDGRKTLQGTLAAEGLNLTPYVSTMRLLAGDDREWNAMPIALDNLAGLDLDLRLSAAHAKISNVKFGRTAIAANLRGGKLSVTVGESQSFGGVIKGSFELAKSPNGADVKADLQFVDVDLKKCIDALLGTKRLEGSGDIILSIEGSGPSVMAVTQTLHGSATLTATKGALAGVNVEQLLRRLERRPLSGGGEYRSGRTPYDKLAVMLSVAEGVVTANDVRMEGPSVRLNLGGQASIPARDLEINGTASLVQAAGTEAPNFELPFMVRGAWDDPLMLLDTQSLLKRAPAAAPLLDAMRNRTARDSVRSVIDRVVGTPASATTATTPDND